GNDCPRRNGAVVRSVRRAASDVIEERALDAVDASCRPAGAVARGDTPEILAVAGERKRIAYRVLALHLRRTAAVLEVVDPLLMHEGVLNASKIQPDVRVLVHEE